MSVLLSLSSLVYGDSVSPSDVQQNSELFSHLNNEVLGTAAKLRAKRARIWPRWSVTVRVRTRRLGDGRGRDAFAPRDMGQTEFFRQSASLARSLSPGRRQNILINRLVRRPSRLAPFHVSSPNAIQRHVLNNNNSTKIQLNKDQLNNSSIEQKYNQTNRNWTSTLLNKFPIEQDTIEHLCNCYLSSSLLFSSKSQIRASWRSTPRRIPSRKARTLGYAPKWQVAKD